MVDFNYSTILVGHNIKPSLASSCNTSGICSGPYDLAFSFEGVSTVSVSKPTESNQSSALTSKGYYAVANPITDARFQRPALFQNI